VKFIDYVVALRRSWLWIVLFTVVGAVALSVPNTTAPRSYRVSMRVVVGPGESIQGSAIDDAVRNLTTNGAVLKTFALMLKSDDVVTKAASTAGIDQTALREYTVDAFSLNETAAVQLEVNGPESTRAAQLADGIARSGVEQFQTLYRSFKAEALDAAVPTRQKSQAALYGFVGAVGGFVVAFLLAVARFAIAQAGGLKRGAPQPVNGNRPRRGRAAEEAPAGAAYTYPPFSRAWEIATARPRATAPQSDEETVSTRLS
jgi:capsular polysaccharide biosynthesis protein